MPKKKAEFKIGTTASERYHTKGRKPTVRG
jgi:hypothetical protein